MPDSLRENLLGYLIGALEPQESQELEDALAGDVRLRQELDLMQLAIAPLQGTRAMFDPPPGLASRGVRFAVEHRSMAPVDLRPVARPGRWSWTDLAVAATVLVSAGLLLFPAIGNTRAMTQQRSCQANLIQLGKALTQYSERDGDKGFFPKIPQAGAQAAAGIYGPLLLENRLLPDERLLVCPGDRNLVAAEFHVPSLQDLDASHGATLQELQRRMGGSYGYTYGHLANGEYQHTRNFRRPRFAVLGDAPSADGFHSYNHGGCGQNVWFEDGHVDYLTTCFLAGADDNYFRNLDGEVGPG